MHHFITTCEFKLELRYGTAKWGHNLFGFDFWPLTLTFCTDTTSVDGKNSWKSHDDTMTGTLWKCVTHERTDGQTDRRMERRAAWSQLKRTGNHSESGSAVLSYVVGGNIAKCYLETAICQQLRFNRIKFTFGIQENITVTSDVMFSNTLDSSKTWYVIRASNTEHISIWWRLMYYDWLSYWCHQRYSLWNVMLCGIIRREKFWKSQIYMRW